MWEQSYCAELIFQIIPPLRSKEYMIKLGTHVNRRSRNFKAYLRQTIFAKTNVIASRIPSQDHLSHVRAATDGKLCRRYRSLQQIRDHLEGKVGIQFGPRRDRNLVSVNYIVSTS